MNLKIMVDIDGVLAESDGPLLDIVNSDLGTDFSPSDLTSYHKLDELLEGFHVAPDYLHKIYHGDRFILRQPVYAASITGMRLLAGMGELHIVTARDPEAGPHVKKETKQWLDEHGFVYEKLVFSRDKAAYCRSTGCRYAIEDAPQHADALAKAGIGVLLVDKPYNQEVKATGANGIWRIIHLSEAAGIIKHDLGLAR